MKVSEILPEGHIKFIKAMQKKGKDTAAKNAADKKERAKKYLRPVS